MAKDNDKFPCKDCGKLLSVDDENWDYCDECGEPVCNDCSSERRRKVLFRVFGEEGGVRP